MSLTIGEANGVFAILRHFLTRPGDDDHAPQAYAAAESLSARAYRRLEDGGGGGMLAAGMRRDELTRLWSAYEVRTSILVAFLDVFDAEDLLLDLGPKLTCTEADALIQLLSVYGRQEAAESLLAAHTESDEEGDAHWPGGAS